METMSNLRGRIPSVMLVALVLALSRLQSIGAVDILFWSQPNCLGQSVGCFGIPAGVCCSLPPTPWPSVQVRNSTACQLTRIFIGGGCSTVWGAFTGNVCASGARFTGGLWVPICRRRQLLADVSDDEQQACTDSSGCKNVMDPNALVYTSGEGNWVLIKDNALGLYEQLTNVPDSEKVAWLTAQGATYTSKTE